MIIDNTAGIISSSDYPEISKKIMSPDYIPCEQVGFLVKAQNPLNADLRLEMMGGELCGNGLRGLGYINFLNTKSKQIILESSGTNSTFTIKILDDKQVELSSESRIISKEITSKLNLVHLEGISHFIENIENSIDQETIMNRFESLKSKYSAELKSIEAIGYIPTFTKNSQQEIIPYVYVEKMQSGVFETGCGPGSIAVAFINYIQQKKETQQIKQPSGMNITVNLHSIENNKYSISIKSPVKITLEGTISIQ